MLNNSLQVAVQQWRDRGLVWDNRHQRESTTHFIGKRKKKHQKIKKPTPFTSKTKSLHQTTLHGSNLETLDAEQWGDPLNT
jgi:hypothetical protein